MKKRKLTALGMPRYIASGSHEYNNKKYRFLVIDRYGIDLCKLFAQHRDWFPEHVVYKLALQIVSICKINYLYIVCNLLLIC